MNSTIFFSACSLLYCILLLIIFKIKKINLDDKNKILKILLVVNLFGLIFEVLGLFLGDNYEKFRILNDIILRLILVYYFTWVSIFIIYVMVISDKNEKINKKKLNYWLAIYIIVLVVSFFLPLNYNMRDGIIIYTSGPAIDLVYFYSLFCDI